MRRRLAISLVVAILMLVAAGTLLWSLWYGDCDLDEEMAAWRAVGGVSDRSGLHATATSASSNAALVYDEAHALLLQLDADAEGLLAGEPFDLTMEAREFVGRARPVVDLVASAATLDDCMWLATPTTGIAGLDEPLTHVRRVRLLARLLSKEAALASEQGDDRRAQTALLMLLRLAEQLSQRLTSLIEYVVVLSLERHALDGFEQLFRDRPLADPQAVRERLDRRDATRFARVVMAEGATGIGAFADPAFGMGSGAVLRKWPLECEQAAYVRVMRKELELARKPFFERAGEAHQPPRGATIARALMPVFENAHAQNALIETRCAMLRTALELRAERDRTGVYPARQSMPIDRLSGEPLRLTIARDGERFVISTPPTADPGAIWTWD